MRACYVSREERQGAHGFGHTIHELAHLWSAELDRRVRHLGLNRPRCLVIGALTAQGALPQGKLAKMVCIRDATLTSLLDQLEAGQLIQRQESEVDRRQRLVSLTDKGRKLYDQLAQAMKALREELLTDVPSERLAMAHETLLAIRDKLAR